MNKTLKYLHGNLGSYLSCLNQKQRDQFEQWKKSQDYDLCFWDPENEEKAVMEEEAQDIQNLWEMIEEMLQAEKDAQDADAFRRVISIIKEEWS